MIHKLFKLSVYFLMAIGLTSPVVASEGARDVIVIKDLVDEFREQSIVLLNEVAYQEVISAPLRHLMSLPKTQHRLISPRSIYGFTPLLTSRCHQVEMNKYAFAKVTDLKECPFLITRGLAECVAVGVCLPGRLVGLIHAGFASVDRGLLDEFFDLFPRKVRAQCELRLLTSALTQLTGDVYNAAIKAGFKVSSVDIIDIYLDCKGRTSSGTKYFPYERLGLAEIDTLDLKYRPQHVIKATVESRSGFAPQLANHYRTMVLDSQTGDSCQFLEDDVFPCANSELIDFIAVVFQKLAPFPATQQEELLQSSLKKFLQRRLEMMREISFGAMNSIGRPYGTL